jgi:hypothetical protein
MDLDTFGHVLQGTLWVALIVLGYMVLRGKGHGGE